MSPEDVRDSIPFFMGLLSDPIENIGKWAYDVMPEFVERGLLRAAVDEMLQVFRISKVGPEPKLLKGCPKAGSREPSYASIIQAISTLSRSFGASACNFCLICFIV
ncbi:hypothetical protein PQ610_02095 [Tardisphaera miroshnichenkoae]